MHRLWRNAADLVGILRKRLFRSGWIDGVPTLDIKDVISARAARGADIVDINSVSERLAEKAPRAAGEDAPPKVATKQ